MIGITDGALHEIMLEMLSLSTDSDMAPGDGARPAGEAPDAAGPADPMAPFSVVTRDMVFEFHDGAEPMSDMA